MKIPYALRYEIILAVSDTQAETGYAIGLPACYDKAAELAEIYLLPEGLRSSEMASRRRSAVRDCLRKGRLTFRLTTVPLGGAWSGTLGEALVVEGDDAGFTIRRDGQAIPLTALEIDDVSDGSRTLVFELTHLEGEDLTVPEGTGIAAAMSDEAFNRQFWKQRVAGRLLNTLRAAGIGVQTT